MIDYHAPAVLRRPLALASLLLGLLAPAGLSAEQKNAQDEPLKLSADKLEIDIEAKTAHLEGHVALEKGAVTLRCPRVDVRYDKVPNVTWARGSGGVVAEVKGTHAEAPEVEIDLTTHQLELRGGVRITRGEGWITAERASVDLQTYKVSMTLVKGAVPSPNPTPPAPSPAP